MEEALRKKKNNGERGTNRLISPQPTGGRAEKAQGKENAPKMATKQHKGGEQPGESYGQMKNLQKCLAVPFLLNVPGTPP